MAGRTVDLVASGPPSLDPYSPAAAAWTLAAALARRGDDVAVLFPAVPGAAPGPDRVASVPLELPLRRPGSPVEAAELASAAGPRVRPHADIVVRDPVGLGSLGLRRGRGSGPIVGGFVRGLELAAYDGAHAAGGAGLRDRLDRWRDRRSLHRLEEIALRECDRLFCDVPDLPRRLADAYGIPASRCRPALPAVASTGPTHTLESARASFRLPIDVPVVAAPASFERPEPSGTDLCREAFRRVRSFFPGARLLVTGTTAPAEAHVTVAPERDGDTLARALSAADVAIFDRREPGFDPGVILALRAGRATILGPGVRLPADPGDAARSVTSDDPGELASVLAELLADPASRRPLATAAVRYASAYEPDRIAETVAADLAPIMA